MSIVITHRSRISGEYPARFVQKRRIRGLPYHKSRIGHYPVVQIAPQLKIDDFVLYSEPDEDEEQSDRLGFGNEKPFSQRCCPVSYNVADYIQARSLGLGRHISAQINEEYGTRHMLTTGMFKETDIALVPPSPPLTLVPLDDQLPRRPQVLDKLFCSQWLNDSKIIMGTKCHKIKIYDTNNHKLIDLPQLSHSVTEPPAAAAANQHGGVYAIEINPSRTLMATVDQVGKDIAIYSLPDLTPVCVGKNSHTDTILDLCWLDDDFLVSGGMDKQMALWRMDDYPNRSTTMDDYPNRSTTITSYDDDDDDDLSIPALPTMEPLRIKKCTGADKVRALIFNEQKKEIVSLSTNAFIHVWNPERFYQKMSRKLPHAMENVCLTQRHDFSLYAIGSKSHFTLLDPRTLHHVKKVSARINGCSVKSLSFQRDILTIGTAVGAILFYDMRAGKYMESTMNSGRAVMLKCSGGYVHLEELAMEMMPNVDYSPTIYTHCYDHSGTRLFTGGGPLSVGLRGHYAGIWQ